MPCSVPTSAKLNGRELVAENPLAVGFRDGFPVDPGER